MSILGIQKIVKMKDTIQFNGDTKEFVNKNT